MRGILVILAGLLAGFSASSAQAVVIDFDSIPVFSYNPLYVDGFKFSVADPLGNMRVFSEGADDNALMVTRGASVNPNGGLNITGAFEAIDGSLFSFLGAEISLDARLDNPRTDIIGFDENGQLVWDPIGTGGWLSVKRVVFIGQSCCGPGIELLKLTIDNVNATVIPVPAPVVLMFSGLLALIPFRRKPL